MSFHPAEVRGVTVLQYVIKSFYPATTSSEAFVFRSAPRTPALAIEHSIPEVDALDKVLAAEEVRTIMQPPVGCWTLICLPKSLPVDAFV